MLFFRKIEKSEAEKQTELEKEIEKLAKKEEEKRLYIASSLRWDIEHRLDKTREITERNIKNLAFIWWPMLQNIDDLKILSKTVDKNFKNTRLLEVAIAELTFKIKKDSYSDDYNISYDSHFIGKKCCCFEDKK